MTNFFNSGLRILWTRKSFSFLNIIGLAVGIATSLLIFLVIKNEFSFDNYHLRTEDIFRVNTTMAKRSNGEIVERNSSVPGPMPEALRQDFPLLEKVGVAQPIGGAQIYVPSKNPGGEEKRFKENEGLYWLEPELFEIFDCAWLQGNAQRLAEPHTVVLSETIAKKYYGSAEAAFGSTIQLWSFRISLLVVGVYKDLPNNTDLPIQVGASLMTVKKDLAPNLFSGADAWTFSLGNYQCFVRRKKDVTTASLTTSGASFVGKYFQPDKETNRQLFFQPLSDIHFNKEFSNIRQDALSKKELWSLGLIGIFLLLVACVNFINLATAQSVNRAKEIGVRKVLGGNRSQLIRQFLQETGVITFIAMIVGCALAIAALPMLNSVMHKGLSVQQLFSPAILLFIVLAGMAVTLLAGFYPAMVLSGFKPATVFKYKVRTKAGGVYLRRGLVVFQFVIAQLLIIGTVVVINQMHYFRSKPVGFRKDGIVLVNLPSDSALKAKYPMMRARVDAIPGVLGTTFCLHGPANNWSPINDVYYNNESKKREFQTQVQIADSGFCNTFGISLLTGRIPFASDSIQELLVNEAMTRKLGLTVPADIIGQSISFDGEEKHTVVGVVKDYNSRSLREAIAPVVIGAGYRNSYEWMAVRTSRDNMSRTLGEVRKLFTSIYPSYLYDQYFYDQELEKFYENEAITAQLFKIFSFLAIFISCLGLYGLVSFMAIQKTKEVGIRKVLGASVKSIVYLFSREFTLLIGIAFVIAAPIGYYFMHGWLSGFYYHTGIGAGVFIMAIVGSLLIAWITVGYKAVKAALVNPVKSLKTE